MKKLTKLFLLVAAPLVVLSACATTPKCDNDACYNRQISSVNKATEADDQDQSAKAEYFHNEGFHRD